MNAVEINALLAQYRARLALAAGSSSSQSVLVSILRDIENKVQHGTLTKAQAEELVKRLFSYSFESFGIEGLESLSESIEKGAVDISFDHGDSLADTVAALKTKK
ncbi:hypothetical protein [Pantoea sp. FN0307]|uniref:hypothetical protein n=1 Tax=Pantoea sp. FN0307 TaxID=3418560 RepID=UPI003CF4003D